MSDKGRDTGARRAGNKGLAAGGSRAQALSQEFGGHDAADLDGRALILDACGTPSFGLAGGWLYNTTPQQLHPPSEEPMPQYGLIHRILIASPSDCVLERQELPTALHAWNAAHSLHVSAILEPVLWETHARPALGDRPQAIINEQLVDTCNLLVATIWTRLGTQTGKAKSGTVEEISEFRAKGKPVFLYFSTRPAVLANVDAEQYKALTDCKESLRGQGLTFDYASIDELRGLFQSHIAGFMATQHTKATLKTQPRSMADEQPPNLKGFIEAYIIGSNMSQGAETPMILTTVTISNPGESSIAQHWSMSLRTSAGELIKGQLEWIPKEMQLYEDGGPGPGQEAQPAKIVRESDGIYNITMNPIPRGGKVLGYLMALFPGMTSEQVQTIGNTIIVEFQDVNERPYSCSATIQGPPGPLAPAQRHPGERF